MSKSKYDNEFKGLVIENGLVKELVNLKKEIYKGAVNRTINEYDGEVIDVPIDWATFSAINRNENKEFDCAFLLVRSKRSKARKVKEKISNIVLSHNAVFLTLTFRDEVIEKTSPTTRRRYVARYLKEQCDGQYVANIDFSPDVGREHYHAVVDTRINLKAWKYGFSYVEQIRAHDRDLSRISKYITKLTAHALKVDATRLIYSRA